MSKAVTIEHFRRVVSRRASLVAAVPASTFYRWKHGDGEISLNQAQKLAEAKGLQVVFVREEADLANVTAPIATAPDAAPAITPIAPLPSATPPACACVRQWLRAQAALHVPPKTKVRPKPIILRKRYSEDP